MYDVFGRSTQYAGDSFGTQDVVVGSQVVSPTGIGLSVGMLIDFGVDRGRSTVAST